MDNLTLFNKSWVSNDQTGDLVDILTYQMSGGTPISSGWGIPMKATKDTYSAGGYWDTDGYLAIDDCFALKYSGEPYHFRTRGALTYPYESKYNLTGYSQLRIKWDIPAMGGDLACYIQLTNDPADPNMTGGVYANSASPYSPNVYDISDCVLPGCDLTSDVYIRFVADGSRAAIQTLELVPMTPSSGYAKGWDYGNFVRYTRSSEYSVNFDPTGDFMPQNTYYGRLQNGEAMVSKSTLGIDTIDSSGYVAFDINLHASTGMGTSISMWVGLAQSPMLFNDSTSGDKYMFESDNCRQTIPEDSETYIQKFYIANSNISSLDNEGYIRDTLTLDELIAKYNAGYQYLCVLYETPQCNDTSSFAEIINPALDVKLPEGPIQSCPFRIRVGDVYKEATKSFVKVDGAWKEITKTYIKLEGAWKEC